MKLVERAKSTWAKVRASLRSISDPHLAEMFSLGTPNYAGVNVSEHSSLSLSAVWRAVSLISGTLASLPLRTVREVDGQRTQVRSVLDNPGGAAMTRFEWVEMIVVHLLLHGNAFLVHVYNGAGALAALIPIHPACVTVDWADGQLGMRKVYTVTLDDGTRREFDDTTMTHLMGMSLDGLRGMSVISQARNGFGTALAGDRAAAKVFSTGALYGGLVTPDEDVESDEALEIKKSLNANGLGWEHAGEIIVMNRRLKFQPWSMSMEDAQFLESRQFAIEEIARWFGVPPFELMQTEKQTSWGAGIEKQQLALARQVLGTWAERISQRLTRLVPQRFVVFDFAGLERPTPEKEIQLLIAQVQGGILTPNEARRLRHLPPIEGGDTLAPLSQMTQQEEEAVPV